MMNGIIPLLAGAWLALAFGTASAVKYIVPPSTIEEAPYADWAHAHWVWLSAVEGNQVNSTKLFDDYLAHDIPVGNLHIDSTWSTGVNSFVFDKEKFPNPAEMIDYVHQKGAKMTLWATSMIDTDSPNFEYANSSGFFIKNALNGTSLLKWWHGYGGLLDYTNPDALEYWHSLLDNVLDLGFDGWKVDGTDPFIMEYIVPESYKGPITYREYADLYYGDFFNYTRQKNGEHCLTWGRPVDSFPLIGEELSAYLPYSPKFVMFAGWVGDQNPNFEGLRFAMRNIIHSAWHNYTNFGSDIGGYRKGPGLFGRTTELFTRWFQMGAFVPLMENGGEEEHRPWKFDTDGSTVVTDTYRRFTHAHVELTPYLLTTGTESYREGISAIRPSTPAPADLPLLQWNTNLTDFSYKLGKSIFVHPITEENTTVIKVSFPKTTDGSPWIDYFNASRKYAAGSTAVLLTPLDYFPVFQEGGSILPLTVTTDATAWHPLSRFVQKVRSGVETSDVGMLRAQVLPTTISFSMLNLPEQALTLAINHPTAWKEKHINIHRFQRIGIEAAYSTSADSMTVTVSATSEPVIVTVRGVRASSASSLTALTSTANLRTSEAIEAVRVPCPDSSPLIQLLSEGVALHGLVWFSCEPDGTLSSPWAGSAVGATHEIVVISRNAELGLNISAENVNFAD